MTLFTIFLAVRRTAAGVMGPASPRPSSPPLPQPLPQPFSQPLPHPSPRAAPRHADDTPWCCLWDESVLRSLVHLCWHGGR